jgi:hypothetical protein
MVVSSLDNPSEYKSVSEYLNYIGHFVKILLHTKIYLIIATGLSDDPIFTMASPDTTANIISEWGTGKPPGGSGDCLVIQRGVFYNASCDQEINFSCEEKALPPGVTTTP